MWWSKFSSPRGPGLICCGLQLTGKRRLADGLGPRFLGIPFLPSLRRLFSVTAVKWRKSGFPKSVFAHESLQQLQVALESDTTNWGSRKKVCAFLELRRLAAGTDASDAAADAFEGLFCFQFCRQLSSFAGLLKSAGLFRHLLPLMHELAVPETASAGDQRAFIQRHILQATAEFVHGTSYFEPKPVAFSQFALAFNKFASRKNVSPIELVPFADSLDLQKQLPSLVQICKTFGVVYRIKPEKQAVFERLEYVCSQLASQGKFARLWEGIVLLSQRKYDSSRSLANQYMLHQLSLRHLRVKGMLSILRHCDLRGSVWSEKNIAHLREIAVGSQFGEWNCNVFCAAVGGVANRAASWEAAWVHEKILFPMLCMNSANLVDSDLTLSSCVAIGDVFKAAGAVEDKLIDKLHGRLGIAALNSTNFRLLSRLMFNLAWVHQLPSNVVDTVVRRCSSIPAAAANHSEWAQLALSSAMANCFSSLLWSRAIPSGKLSFFSSLRLFG